MGENIRLHQFFECDRELATELFAPFQKGMTLDSVIPIYSGMSTSNYCVVSGERKYLLKIYAGNTGSIENVIYKYLKKYDCTPTLYYYDDSNQRCPYPYAIIEYIDGETFSEYVQRCKAYPEDKVYRIGEILSMIHEKSYLTSGLLDRQLQIKKHMKSTKELILEHLNGKAGQHLSQDCGERLAFFADKGEAYFNRIDQEFVLCHGDIGSGNILVSHEKVYFIDFEYSLAESRYRDIGKFFRNKTPEVQQYISKKTYDAFTEGYCAAGYKLPEDWLQLGKLAEIPVLLGLLNRDNPPSEWVTDIEHDVIEAIQMFNLLLL